MGQLAWITPQNPDSNMSKELYFRRSATEKWRHWTCEFEPAAEPRGFSPGYGIFCQLVKRGWQVVQTSDVVAFQVDHTKPIKEG